MRPVCVEKAGLVSDEEYNEIKAGVLKELRKPGTLIVGSHSIAFETLSVSFTGGMDVAQLGLED